MKHSIFFLFTIFTLLTFQGCGGGGGDEASTVLSTSTSSTTTDEPVVVPTAVIVDITKDLVTADPIDNRIVEPIVMSTPTPPKVINTDVGLSDPIASQDMWSQNVLLDSNPNEYYVAVDGNSSNSGTKESPWDLLSVANGDHAIPGNSIVWLEPGEYKNPNTTQLVWQYFNFKLSGEKNAPIHIRPLPQSISTYAQRVTIDGGIRVEGSWLWIWDIEQTPLEDWRPWDVYFDSLGYDIIEYGTQELFDKGLYDIAGNIEHGVGDTQGKLSNRRKPMEVIAGTNSKFINMNLHGLFSGLGFWANAEESEFYGNLVYDNGYIDQERAHGPGLYIQNESGTNRIANDNIVAGNYSNPMQMTSKSIDKLSGLTMIGNIYFAPRVEASGRNYLHVGDGDSHDILAQENITHGLNMRYPYSGWDDTWISPDDQVCSSNYFYRTYTLAGLTCLQGGPNEDIKSPLDEALTKAFIRPNKYDSRRANLAILNGERKADISISLGEFAKENDIIMIIDAVNPYAEPIAYGKYNGQYLNIHFPNTSWNLESERFVQDSSTLDKEFWAFVIIKLRQ